MANNKIKVTGRAQNSTALGIVHAYIQMFPKTAHPINSGERKKKNLIFASWKIRLTR